MQHQVPTSYPTPSSPNSNSGARLTALLGSKQQQQQPSANSTSEFSNPIINPPIFPSAAPPLNFAAPFWFPSSKFPRGRHLVGNRVVYDIDVRLEGESQPQLEVTPITKYISDPALVLGRQIAVNKTYICYGLKVGSIRVLNINTALRSLLRGHTQRVSDMAFFADDAHLLASASVDGRVFIWKIDEGPDNEGKPQITGKVVIALEITGGSKAVQPCVCWHCHKQEILVVAVGNHILKINTMKVGKGEQFLSEKPLKCPVDKLIDGVQFVGKHDGEVTALSMCQWMTTRLASASTDGTVKIWTDHTAMPLAVLRPHDGHPVNSVILLTSPHRPDHIILITAGPLNREVKILSSTSEEGWLLPSDSELWECTQTLDFRSSAESRVENAFFNQVVALPQAGLLLLANAKKNAIYAVHVEYGPNPASTRMDYIAEFTVAMPILSLTGTSDSLPDGEIVMQVYCVQTQAIQQYALNLSQCLPQPLEIMGLERAGSGFSHASDSVNSNGLGTLELYDGNRSGEMQLSIPNPMNPINSTNTNVADNPGVPMVNCSVKSSSFEVTGLRDLTSSHVEPKPSVVSSSSNAENPHSTSPLPLSPRLSGKSSEFKSPSKSYEHSSPQNECGDEKLVFVYSIDRRVEVVDEDLDTVPSPEDDVSCEESATQHDISIISDSPEMFKHPTHLITPSEIISKAASSSSIPRTTSGIIMGETKIQDIEAECLELEVKVVEETGGKINDLDSHRDSDIIVSEKKEKSFYSQASELSIRLARDLCVDTYIVNKGQQANGVATLAAPARTNDDMEDVQDSVGNASENVGEKTISGTSSQSHLSGPEERWQKRKNSQLSGPTTDSSNEPIRSSDVPTVGAALSQLWSVQENLNELTSMHKEMQQQMSCLVSGSLTKEGRRLEASLGRSLEKVVKASNEALWACFQEENAKHERLEQVHTQTITNLITSFVNKDLPAILEKSLKKEIAAIGPAVARNFNPLLEKTISSAILEFFQKGAEEKVVNQLEKLVNMKLDATLARQIQAQFQTSGKQVLLDALRSSFEASVISTFEASCKAMFEQVDAAFQKGFAKHANAARQQFKTTHSPLAVAVKDAINSASLITKTLSGELTDGQHKLLAMAATGANSKAVNPLVAQLGNGPLVGLHEMVEKPFALTKELSRLLSESKYEEAFATALQRSDVSIVSWLCSQVDLQGILSVVPLPLSQGVLLALLQQLACDINKEKSRKLEWMTHVAIAMNPTDPMIAMHVRPIFEQVYQILGHQRSLPSTQAAEASSIRLLMHVINSVLTTCK
ncbi:hypothetical protein NMG60_11022618 [Bertholletia excelsa]